LAAMVYGIICCHMNGIFTHKLLKAKRQVLYLNALEEYCTTYSGVTFFSYIFSFTIFLKDSNENGF
jgi:hypothetical protein